LGNFIGGPREEKSIKANRDLTILSDYNWENPSPRKSLINLMFLLDD